MSKGALSGYHVMTRFFGMYEQPWINLQGEVNQMEMALDPEEGKEACDTCFLCGSALLHPPPSPYLLQLCHPVGVGRDDLFRSNASLVGGRFRFSSFLRISACTVQGCIG